MAHFILDTDTLSLLQAGHPLISERAMKCPAGEMAITAITVDEQLRGWYTLVRRAKKPAQVAKAYDRLARSVSFLSRTVILPFPETAIMLFDKLRKAKLGVDGNDLRIAAIALDCNAIVVTRNLRDFKLIPDLRIEDWSQ
jgi:tRNA(fMet)-specific endonuclease VapC